MTLEDAFERMIRKLIQGVPAAVTVGIATNIDKETGMCDVNREDAPTLHRVRIDVIAGIKKGLTIYPKDKSLVACITIEGNPMDAYLLAVSEADEIRLGGKEAGGIVLSGYLFDRLQKIEQSLSDLITSYKTHTHPVSGTAAGAIMPTPIIGDPGTTKQNDLESKIVYQ